ncbi:flagellar hook-basal body complex protein FliE [Pseudohoeflea coraliihabitans]|uniref:Flagellar hook-basal body complex protein FliE n=1 Tax=Pseudohoeflea coraliihabitans TaxID=2860393 RepID=A0ABS6WN33_9HYPH|nr:flagellar hook-basal body complex protein FliE [Pseudohoeflea sp. DP4N28-3]MBW3097372.1 flagellar hook-basal body complex protein FliE [Pseudohoeflea sp. DP4N28-3]
MIDLVGGVAGKAASQILKEVLDTTGNTPAAPSAGTATGPSFFDALQSVGNGVVADLKGAETQSFRAVAGEANPRELVDSLMNAEQSLQTAIAIRDKLVTAYLEISRMQI